MINNLMFYSYKGVDMQRGATVNDYTVTIGLGQCEKPELNSNSFQCKLPEDEPEPGQDNPEDGTLQVTVSITTLCVAHCHFCCCH